MTYWPICVGLLSGVEVRRLGVLIDLTVWTTFYKATNLQVTISVNW